MLKKVFYTVKITTKYAAVPALLKIGLYAAAGVMSTLSVVFTQGLINSLAGGGKGIVIYLILLLGVSVFISITGSAGSLINIFLKRSLSRKLAEDILTKFRAVRYDCYDNAETYNIISKMGQKPEDRLTEAFDGIVGCGRSLIAVAGSVVVFSQLGAGFTLIYIAFLLPIFFLNSRFCGILEKVFEDASADERKMNYCQALMFDKKSHLELKVFDCMDFVLGKWRSLQKKVLKTRIRMIIKGQKYMLFGNGVFMLWVIFLLFVLIGRAWAGSISIGVCSALLLANREAVTNAADFVWGLGGINESLLFVEYFRKFMDLPERKVDGVLNADFNEIKLENISFAYPNCAEPVLKNINMTIKNNRHIAIVGENGSGKSTLVKLLCGLYAPDCGVIAVDGEEALLSECDSLFNAVFQDFGSYCLTLRENVAFGDMKKLNDDREIKEALKKAGFNKDIALNQGLGTISEGGVDLSGGEWQKVSLARGYIANRKYLILDEPTAALDPIAECKMFDDFRKLMQGKGSLIISHRLASAQLADEIIVMSGGQIVERGTHEDLTAQNGLYKKMWEAQREWYDEKRA